MVRIFIPSSIRWPVPVTIDTYDRKNRVIHLGAPIRLPSPWRLSLQPHLRVSVYGIVSHHHADTHIA